MEQKCAMLPTCGFFKKYQATRNMACKGFINKYCEGNLMNQCKRKEYRSIHGVAPSDNMLPTGLIMAECPN